MLWPLVLPFQITFWLLVAFVAVSTIFAPKKWARSNVFGISLVLGCVAFIPSCMGIMSIVDSQRFGIFQYHSAADVNDFHVEHYLPQKAQNITLMTYVSGHRAKYSISKADLLSFLDAIWDKYGQYSDVPRNKLPDGEAISADIIEVMFPDLKWPALKNPTVYRSPVGSRGSGATYYFDATTNTVYHIASYW